MNKKLLAKVIEELAKDKPDLSYIRGMLETMMEMDIPVQVGIGGYGIPNVISQVQTGSVTSHTELNPAEQAAQMAEAGFIKGTKPMSVTETNIILE